MDEIDEIVRNVGYITMFTRLSAFDVVAETVEDLKSPEITLSVIFWLILFIAISLPSLFEPKVSVLRTNILQHSTTQVEKISNKIRCLVVGFEVTKLLFEVSDESDVTTYCKIAKLMNSAAPPKTAIIKTP